MRHLWDEPENCMGVLVAQCRVCGGYRSQRRNHAINVVRIPNGIIDLNIPTRKGWQLDDGTPRGCPGQRLYDDYTGRPVDRSVSHE